MVGQIYSLIKVHELQPLIAKVKFHGVITVYAAKFASEVCQRSLPAKLHVRSPQNVLVSVRKIQVELTGKISVRDVGKDSVLWFRGN
jgi:hypothetical protein